VKRKESLTFPTALRYSLRTLLLAITLFALFFGTWIRNANRHEFATKKLRSKGVFVEDRFEDPIGPNIIYSFKQAVPRNGYFPKWFANNFCVKGSFIFSVVDLSLKPEDWLLFKDLENLRHLVIVDSELSPGWVSQIAECRYLSVLVISRSIVGLNDIPELGSLNQLSTLELLHTNLSAQDIAVLRSKLPLCEIVVTSQKGGELRGRELRGVRESAGLNRLGIGNERILQRRPSQ